MKTLRNEIRDLRGLRLTARGQLVRDLAVAVMAAPVGLAFLLVMIAGLEGMGL